MTVFLIFAICIRVMLFKLISLLKSGQNDVFLRGVKYHSKVQFVPLSEISFCDKEHTVTNPIFIRAAESNTKKGWESLGIPPVEVFKHMDMYFHVMGEGQTRLNSAHAIKCDGKEICIPIWNVTDSVIILKNALKFRRPQIRLVIGHKKSWNISGSPLTSPRVWGDEAEELFCGLS
jgi:hypothetical protein